MGLNNCSVIIQQNNTVRVAENFADSSQIEYLESLEKELSGDKVILDQAKEKKICDTLVKLLLIPDLAPKANKWQAPPPFVRLFGRENSGDDCLLLCAGYTNSLGMLLKKLRTVELVGHLADQLYDNFVTHEHSHLAIEALKTLATDLPQSRFNSDFQHHHYHGLPGRATQTSRDVQMAYQLLHSIVPRIIGGISKARRIFPHNGKQASVAPLHFFLLTFALLVDVRLMWRQV